MQISGKTVLVTGGTDGIGLEIARQLKAKGATVIVCGRRQDLLDRAATEGMIALYADLSNAAGCAALVAAVRNYTLDILVNNAGMGGDYDANGVMDLDIIDRAIFLNFNAPAHLIAQLVSGLKTRPEAAIVNVTSGLAIAPNTGAAIYCGTKAALRSFTMSLRSQLKRSRVRVIEALPPLVETAMTSDIAGKGKISPGECARQIVAGLVAGKSDINVGQVKFLKGVFGLSPALARTIMLRF
jgi:uncharacterized oxidoreductase